MIMIRRDFRKNLCINASTHKTVAHSHFFPALFQKVPSKPREIWFVYSGMGSQWVGMGRCLMALDIFRESIQECSDALIPFGVDLMDLIMNGTEDKLKTIVAPFVCISAVQVSGSFGWLFFNISLLFQIGRKKCKKYMQNVFKF